MLSLVLRVAAAPQNRVLSKLAAFATFALLLVTAACSSTQLDANISQAAEAQASPLTSTLRLGYIATGGTKAPSVPTGWALHEGILKQELQEEGIVDVQVVGFPNGPDLNEALVAGELDVGIYGDTPAVVAKARGVNTRLLALEQVDMNVWLVGARHGVTSLDDLKGRQVATQPGSYMHRYLIGTLKETGLTQSVTFAHLLGRDAEAALERGDIAAYAAPVGLGPLLLSKGFPLLDEADKRSNLSGTSVIVVTDDFLAKHPDLPQVWNQLRQDAVKDIQSNPEEYYKFHADVTGLPIAVVKESYPLSQFPEEPFPAKGLELLEATKSFLVTEGLAQSDYPLTNWIVGQ